MPVRARTSAGYTPVPTHHNNNKIRVAYNNVYRKILDVPKRGSASTMFVSNGIPNFKALIRKSIFSFNSRLQTSCNSLICTIEES